MDFLGRILRWLADGGFLSALADTELDELRVGVKPRETDGDQEKLFERVAAAVRVISDAMVKMSVMPG